MKKLAGMSIALALATAVWAQTEGPIAWLEKDYDFGIFHEADGPRSARSSFRNVSADTIYIMEVKPSCGCTTASFTMNPIAPGDTAFVEYTYDPTRRPGIFDKTIKIRLSDNSRLSVKIYGNVIGTPESLHTLYPKEAGAARLSENVWNAGEVMMGRAPLTFINAYALGPDSLRAAMKSPVEGLRVSQSAPVVGPGEVITFTVDFDSRRHGKFGPVELPLIFSDGDADYEVPVRAYVVPDSELLLKMQGSMHPLCSIAEERIDLGDIPARKNRKVYLDILNDGDADLEIFGLFPDTKGIKVSKLPGKPLKPGKSTSIELVLDFSILPDGPQQHRIAVMTNDPRSCVREVKLGFAPIK